MRYQTSKTVASSYSRGRGRKGKAWFSQALDINHTGSTASWANRQCLTEENNLPLESFVPKLQRQSSIPYQSGKVVLTSSKDRGISTGAPSMNMTPNATTLDFADSNAWPALNTAESKTSSSDNCQHSKDISFVCAISASTTPNPSSHGVCTATTEPKYLHASPAENEWLFLTNRQLYIDILKRESANAAGTSGHHHTCGTSNMNGDTDSLTDARSIVDIDMKEDVSCSDSVSAAANWTFLEHDSVSLSSSYLSEEEDGLGEALAKNQPVQDTRAGTSMFSFLW